MEEQDQGRAPRLRARIFGEADDAREVRPLYAIPRRVKRDMHIGAAFNIVYVIASLAILLGVTAFYVYSIIQTGEVPQYLEIGALLLAIKSPFEGLGLRVKEARIARKNKTNEDIA